MALSLFLNLIENNPPIKVEKNVAIENITASIKPSASYFYFLFSIQSQIASPAVTMHAGTLIHIGTSKRLVVTFTCKISRSKCIIETINKNITVMVVAGFIIVLLTIR